MKSAPALTPLAFSLALCGLAAVPSAAQAQSDWIRECAAGRYEQGMKAPCQQSYSESLAAVLTGSADDGMGAWGYLDKQGRTAIAPAYTEAEPFQNGLAAVSQGERWGYIDHKGQWAIEPRYSRATGFNAEGTALVEEDGRDVLIDRQGKTLKIFPLGTRTWGFEPGQKLAAMEMPAPPRLFNTASGKAVTLPEGVMALAAPTGGYLPAQLRGARYTGEWGMLDANGRWAITPDTLRSTEAPMRDGDVLAVRRADNWQFVDASGKAISPRRYEQVQLVAPGLWLVKRDAAHKWRLLNSRQEVLHRFKADYANLQEEDGWRFLTDDDAVWLIDPAGGFRKIAVSQGRVDVHNGLAWISGGQAGNAVDAAVSDTAGEAQDEATDAIDAASEAAAAAAAAAGGVEISDGGLMQIYARDGKPLLDDATVAQLQAYHLTAFNWDEHARPKNGKARLPLALLRANEYGKASGILTPAGKIVTNADWDDISTYDATLPLPVRTRDGKAGAIDAEGNWAVPPRFSEIKRFRGTYALASLPEATRRRDGVVIDAHGKQAAVPAAVLARAAEFDGELIVYREPDENREEHWGIWSVRDGRPVLKPVHEQIEKFEDDWAKVQDKGRWGVVNRKGLWALPATYESSYELDYLGDGFMLTPDAETEPRRGGYSDRAYRLVNLRTGKSSELLSEKPQKLKDGRYICDLADGGVVLFDARGGALKLSDSRPKRREQYQDWIYVENESRQGAIDARGELKVPARYGEFNPFFAQPEGLARAYDGADYRLIDQNGKTVLAKFGDLTPLAGMQRLVRHDGDSSSSVMMDLQGREIVRLEGAYGVEDRAASEGVVPYRTNGENSKYGFVDANGKRIVGPHFDSLGPLKNGLAVAQRLQRTGKQYGYIDLTGRYAIPPLYARAGDFQEERALVRRDGNTQFIDAKGTPTATFVFVCDTVTILDRAGRIAWPQKKMACPAADRLELAPDNDKAEQQ